MSDRGVPVSAPRVEQVYQEQLTTQRARTSRLFAWLMLAQWAGAVVAALVIAPRTWIGEQHRVHEHVWFAVIIGGVLASLPVWLSLVCPGRALTRHVIAVAQMLFSALLIHLTGGRIETHFHVFGSLAFMAFYRDWRVLLTATVVVAVDHMVRGLFFPLSAFGTEATSQWRWLEHAGWVVFEDIILVLSCVRGLAELRGIADRQVRLEESKAATEREVLERTNELRLANASLKENQEALRTSNEELRASAAEREALHARLMAASREAGMAEVAIGVLHNVGNVLNSVNVSATVVARKLATSEVPHLVKVGDMLREHSSDLPRFLSEDERGRHVPTFLIEATRTLEEDRKCMERELEAVTQGIEQIKKVINLQQSNAKRSLVLESVEPRELADAALEMQAGTPGWEHVHVTRRYEPVGRAMLDRHQVLQILVNLISNAKNAVRECQPGAARVTISVGEQREGAARRVVFHVEDNGVGISAANLDRIFTQTFAVRPEGNGFGLHSAATAAQAMGGALRAFSDGPGTGARFTLALPASDQGAGRHGEGRASAPEVARAGS